MTPPKSLKKPENRVRRHIRDRMLSGLAVLIPVGISWFLLSLAYRATVGVITVGLRPVVPGLPAWVVSVISVAVLLSGLYVLGFLATNVVGRRLIAAAERLVHRIPLVDSIYGTSKQIVDLFRSEPGVARRTAVLAPFPHENTRALGFLTGSVVIGDDKRMATVFIPTTPNPTTGFLQLFPEDRLTMLPWNTDETIQFIMSAGLIQPERPEDDS